ncbi:MAG: M48 family metalloprotease, partial [Bacillota bacterium]
MWEQIKKNRRKTIMYWFLTTLFIIFLLILLTFLAGPGLERKGISTEFVFYFFIIAWVILSIGACLYGDRLLLKVSKANKVNRFVHPQLFNVVEEIKIASDLSVMPDIYIMPSYSINAFATGVRLDHSTIVVTAGLLSKLDRDELQAVIAHEISHIINRDVVLLTFIGTLWGSFLLTLLFFGLLLGGGDKTPKSYRRDEHNFEVKIDFSNIFYSTLSKTREYLADASAVRLTRNPMALASALEKIYIEHNRVDVANSITAPMYIEAPLKTKKTHPPIRDRIKILKEMSYCVNYSEYQRAYNSVLETHKNIIP